MQARAPMATTRSRQAQLAVADDHYDRKLVLSTGDGDANKTVIYVGSSGGHGEVPVRVAGSDAIYSVSSTISRNGSTRLTHWVEPKYVDAPVVQMKSFQVQNEAMSVLFQHADDGTWTAVGLGSELHAPEGQELNQDKIKGMARKIGALRLTAVAGTKVVPDYGLDEPQTTVTVTLKPAKQAAAEADAGPASTTSPAVEEAAGDTFVVTIGAKKDDHYFMKEASNPFVVEALASALDDLVELTPDALYREPKKQAAGGAKPGAMPAGAHAPRGGMPPGMPTMPPH
jgi:hypothetical protein